MGKHASIEGSHTDHILNPFLCYKDLDFVMDSDRQACETPEAEKTTAGSRVNWLGIEDPVWKQVDVHKKVISCMGSDT